MREVLAFSLLYLPIYAGWFFHVSPAPRRVFLVYSREYLPVLLLGAIPLVLGPVLIKLKAAMGPKRFRNLILLLGLATALLYEGFSLHYSWTTEHRFDPWLQLGVYPIASATSPRVLLMGGSTTADRHYEETLRSLLQKKNPETTVLDAGRSWWTSKHSLGAWVTHYRYWKPDTVVLMHAVNDAFRSFSPEDYALGEYDDGWSHYYGPAIDAARAPSFESHVFGRVAQSWYASLRTSARDYPLERWVSRGAFERHVRELVRCIKADGATPVLVTEPYLVKESMPENELAWLALCPAHRERRSLLTGEYPSAASLARALAAFAESTRAIARDEGVLLVDAERAVPKTLEDFVDEVHHTERGAERLAALVADSIKSP